MKRMPDRWYDVREPIIHDARIAVAVTLRNEAWSWGAIGAVLGVSGQRARQIGDKGRRVIGVRVMRDLSQRM